MSALVKRLHYQNLLKPLLTNPRLVRAGTRVGSWKPVKFLITVLQDYAAVMKDSATDARGRPLRTSCIGAVLAAAYLAHKRIPSRTSFTDVLVENNNDFIQIPVRTRNPQSEVFLVEAQRLRNEERLEYHDFGVLSVILRRDFSEPCDVYEARCKYLKTPLEEWFSRLVDVGLWGRWWLLERAMRDFDVSAELD